MKNIFLLLLLFTGIAKGQIVTIPDANFKAKLIGSSTFYATDLNGNYVIVDSNSDGEIQTSEALIIKRLSIGSSNIADLTGIEQFTNLQELICESNSITEFNISTLTNLTILWCGYNPITSISFPLLPNLSKLFINGTPLTSLDISNLPNLTVLYCRDGHFSSLIIPASNI